MDDVPALRRLLAGRTCMLLDFDGPVCAVFAGYPAPLVAQEMRAALRDEGIDLSALGGTTDDPMVLLSEAAVTERGQELAERLLAAAEMRCVESATPTTGAQELLEAAQSAGVIVTIVSNNSEPAIRRYLDAADLTRYVTRVVGRDRTDAALMKPHPHLLARALELGSFPADAAFMVGDSVSDMHSSRTAGALAIGHANKSSKVKALSEAGAAAVVTGMLSVSQALAP